MCTYNITLNDSLIERVRPVFADEKSMQNWMQEQLSLALENLATKEELTPQHKMVKESLTAAFEEMHAGKTLKNARNLFV